MRPEAVLGVRREKSLQHRIIAFLFIALVGFCGIAVHADNVVQVPFVGCPAESGFGSPPPPSGNAQVIHPTIALPGPVAYYKGAEGLGVFAPAGWHCLVIYGSIVATTMVTAKPIPSSPPNPIALKAPAITLSIYDGGTGGRFDVASYGFMLFPNLSRDFVKQVEAEKFVSKKDIERSKYPDDKLKYLSESLAEFITPANKKGLGTQGYINMGDAPVSGLVNYDASGDPDVSVLRISMGVDGSKWVHALIKLNTPCDSSDGC
jgi:hypothetical protein